MILKARIFQMVLGIVLCSFPVALTAAVNSSEAAPTPPPSAETTVSPAMLSNDEIAQLRSLLANQQKQIQELQKAMAEQQQMLERLTGAKAPTSTTPVNPAPLHPRGNLGQVASTTAIVPSGRPPEGLPAAEAIPQRSEAVASSQPPLPPYLQLGNVSIAPVGFMDFTSVWRSTNPGSGIGSNFGSIPYLNTTPGKISEFRLSTQNSRIGARIDGDWKDTHFIGYWESDFLGSPTSANYDVTSHPFLFRMRLYWVDLRKGKLEVLGGQSWSMLTPNRTGISPLPSDVFYSNDIDVNYQVGLVWARTPGLRLVYHATDSLAMGLAFEDPEGSIGGSGGGGAATLPASYTTAYASQLDNGGTNDAVPNVMPDIEAKIAYDYKNKFHAEVAGLVREFKVYNPNNNTHQYATGGGGEVNLNFLLAPGLRILTNNYWSDGGGRYIFGLAPDLVVRGDGSLSPVHSGSMVQGLEYTYKNTLLYAYYGGVYIGRNSQIDPTTGKAVGYGFSGSPSSQNRTIQEATFGFNRTFWKDPRYGAINLFGQYSYLDRNPWAVLTGQPKETHLNILMFNLRYTLPGAAPAVKK